MQGIPFFLSKSEKNVIVHLYFLSFFFVAKNLLILLEMNDIQKQKNSYEDYNNFDRKREIYMKKYLKSLKD